MKTLERAEEVLGTALFALMAALILLGAVGRTLGTPLIWAIDLAQLFFAWAAVLGADIALKRNQHIEIDILVRRFPPPLRSALATLWLVAIAAFLAGLVWLGTRLTLLNLERELGDVGISYGWVTAAIPAGALLLLVSVLHRLARRLRGRERAEHGPEGAVL
ncbi:MAG TPA: TRAP transporter small permease [Beijerinckiaceae bacterium]|nr:TRAP transporter small permease [Beijerinckiaceae bacterium]